jgi:hypothetical protein
VYIQNAGERKEKAMIARLDHRPMLTALFLKVEHAKKRKDR